MNWHLRLVLVLAPILCSCAATPPSDVLTAGNTEFHRFTIPDGAEGKVRYYISRPDEKRPILLYIQGSGCEPVMIEVQPGDYASTVLSYTTAANDRRFAVMIVEKPDAPNWVTESRGTAKDCPAEFNRNFTFGTWLESLSRAYEHAQSLSWTEDHNSLVIGLSEGGTLAAALAEANDSVSHVAIVGGSGTTQLFDMIVAQYTKTPDIAARVALDELTDAVAAVLDDPESSDKFLWGHPYKRWASFLTVSTIGMLERSEASVYILSAMGDRSVPPQSSELIFATLFVSGRTVEIRRLPNLGHSMLSDDFGIASLEAEFKKIRDWFYSVR